MVFDLLLTLLFVLANAFFVAAEFAIVRVRASQLEPLARDGNYFAGLSKSILNNLDAYLSATQFGITLSSLALGWIGATVAVHFTFEFLQHYSLSPETAKNLAIAVSFATIAFLHIVFGGLLPKALALQHSEKVTMSVSLPLRVFYLVFKPFIWIFAGVANQLNKIIGLQPTVVVDKQASSDELRLLIEESSKSGVIDTAEHQLLENIFDFTDTPVKQIMVPRMRISAVDINDSRESIITAFIEEGYSRLPVYDGKIDNIVGEIYGKDLLNMMANPHLISFGDIIRPPFFVQEDENIHKLLKKMQKEHYHMAIVLSEFGGVAGIVTMENIIEEIVGDIQDEYDEEEPLAEETARNEFEIDASIAIVDANAFLPVPLEESDDYETLGGLITNNIGRFPQEDESFVIENYRFTILKSSDRRIEEVKLELILDQIDEENND